MVFLLNRKQFIKRRYEPMKRKKNFKIEIMVIGTLFSYFLFFQLLIRGDTPYLQHGGCCQYNDKIIVNHSHNWSNSDQIRKLIKDENDLIFSEKNDFSYISLTNDDTAIMEWKRPSPALNKIFISENSEYIICLSKIKYYNPYQVVVLKRSGEIIFRRHITAIEAKLSNKEYEEFKNVYNLQDLFLRANYRITIVSDSIFIDYNGENIHDTLGKSCVEYLNRHSEKSHFSANFSEPDDNWIYWYQEPDPQLKFIFNGDQVERISMCDPKGERFEIIILVPQKGLTQKPIPYIPPVAPNYDVKFDCINCRDTFFPNEKICFKVKNKGEDLAIMFGIKVKVEGQWRVLTFTANDAHTKKDWVFKKNETKVITWDKNVVITKDMMEQGTTDSRLLYRYVYYDVSQGGEFALYAWKKSPLSQELFRHEFRIMEQMGIKIKSGACKNPENTK